MANIPLQYPFPYKTNNNTGFTSSVEFNTVTVLGDVTIDQNLTVAGNITTTDLTVGDDLTVGGNLDAQVLRAYGVWDVPTATVTGAGAWIGYNANGHTIFATRKSIAGQTNAFLWYTYDQTNTFVAELMHLNGTRLEVNTRLDVKTNGEMMRLVATDHMYIRYAIGATDYGYLGFASSGTQDMTLYNQRPTGHIFIGMANASGRLRSLSPILLEELVTIQTAPGSATYSFILPSSAGTTGQVLTSAGAGNPLYWSAGGGGGGGTVTNVTGTSPISVTSPTTTPNISLGTVPTTLGGTGLTTVGTNGQVLSSNGTTLQYVTLPTPVTSVSATSPLASSGGATPTISIASFTGTGAVVLQTDPQLLGSTLMASGSGPLLRFTHDVAGGINYIQSGAAFLPGSTQDLNFGPIFSTDSYLRIKANGNVGIGYSNPFTKLHVLGAPDLFGIQYLASTTVLSSTINTIDIIQRWYESTGNASYIDLSWIRTSAGGAWFSAGQRFQAKTDTTFQAYIQFNGDNDHGLSFGTGSGPSAHSIAEQMRITLAGNVGIGTTTPTEKLTVAGNITTTNGSITAKSPGPGTPSSVAAASITIDSGTVGISSLNNTSTIYFNTVGGGGGSITNYIESLYDATYSYYLKCFADNFVVAAPIFATNSINVVNNANCNSMLSSNGGNTGLEMRAIGGISYIDMTAKSTSGAADYDFRISKANDNDVNFLNALSGNFIFNSGVRATLFSTNGLQAFTYASGTFTPRIAMFYTIDGKVYECNAAPAGHDNIAITYTLQTGLWVRMGNTMMINMEIQYNQTYSGIFFNLNDLNIVAVIPEAACNPSTLGAVGVTGYPSRIRDRFVDNFQMNYWISNTAYAPGGTICEVQLRRDNTHNMCPWDPSNKTGERVNITTSYYVNQ